MKKIIALLFLIFTVVSIVQANEDVMIEIGDLMPQLKTTVVQKDEIVIKEKEQVKAVYDIAEKKESEDTKNIVDHLMNKKDITVLTEGEGFSYPIPNGSLIQCYATKIDGSIDDFNEYNDYFLMKNGNLYSNTMHKLYKPKKSDELKLVDRASILKDNKTLKLYDSLWEPSIRRHKRTIKIDTQTGKYYMKGTQDNFTWYRNITATGYCRVINN